MTDPAKLNITMRYIAGFGTVPLGDGVNVEVVYSVHGRMELEDGTHVATSTVIPSMDREQLEHLHLQLTNVLKIGDKGLLDANTWLAELARKHGIPADGYFAKVYGYDEQGDEYAVTDFGLNFDEVARLVAIDRKDDREVLERTGEGGDAAV